MGDPDRLTQDELRAVLRRAAELDHPDTSDHDAGLPLAAVESAAAEVGLAPDVVRQAVAELRAGMLGGDRGDRGLEASASGRGTAVAARVVPWGGADALDALERFFAAKSMERVRDRGMVRVYRRRRDLVAKLNRAVDFGGGSKKLKSVEAVEVRAVEVEGGTLVRLLAELDRGLTNSPLVTAGVAGITTGVVAGVGLAVQVDPDLVGAALGVPVGAGFGVGGWMIARAVVDRHRHRVAEVLDGLLDEMEQGRQPAAGSALARLRHQLPAARRGRQA